MLTVTKYGGNNYRIYACMFPRSFGEACIGPWHIPWFQGEENQRPPRPTSEVLPNLTTDLSRINDIVSWRKIWVQTNAMEEVAPLLPSSFDFVGAFDDGFIQMERIHNLYDFLTSDYAPRTQYHHLTTWSPPPDDVNRHLERTWTHTLKWADCFAYFSPNHDLTAPHSGIPGFHALSPCPDPFPNKTSGLPNPDPPEPRRKIQLNFVKILTQSADEYRPQGDGAGDDACIWGVSRDNGSHIFVALWGIYNLYNQIYHYNYLYFDPGSTQEKHEEGDYNCTIRLHQASPARVAQMSTTHELGHQILDMADYDPLFDGVCDDPDDPSPGAQPTVMDYDCVFDTPNFTGYFSVRQIRDILRKNPKFSE